MCSIKQKKLINQGLVIKNISENNSWRVSCITKTIPGELLVVILKGCCTFKSPENKDFPRNDASICYSSDFLFPLQPPHTPYPGKPPAHPTPKSLISVHFGSVWLRLGSVWLRFGSVLGPFRVRFGVLGGVGERGFCKGNEYHYAISAIRDVLE